MMDERSEESLNGYGVLEAKPFVVVGIPAFNEENSIARVVLGSQKFADAIVVCDDGSTDMTGRIAERLGAYVVRHEENLGYGAALRSIFKRAKELDADILITLDADGQHDPSEIPVVAGSLIRNEADIVIGSRFVRKNGAVEMPVYRRAGAKFITKLVNGSARNGITDSQSGFRAYNRVAMEKLSISENGMGASVELLLEAKKSNLKICEVSSFCKYNRDKDTSSKNAVTHGTSVIMTIVRAVVEERPLQVLGVPGALCLIVGVVFGVWMLQIYAQARAIVTNIALAAIAFVFIGFFMLSTAIMLYAISRLAKRMVA